MANDDFKACLQGYMDACQLRIERDYARNYPRLTPPTVEAQEGPRYVRVFLAEYYPDGRLLSREAHSFIDKRTGDVFMPAGWKSPAKGKRSNIFASDFGMSGVQPSGRGTVYHN